MWNVGYLGTQEYHRYNGACQKAKMLHWNGLEKPYTNEGRGVSFCVDQFDEYDVVSLQNKVECMTRNKYLNVMLEIHAFSQYEIRNNLLVGILYWYEYDSVSHTFLLLVFNQFKII